MNKWLVSGLLLIAGVLPAHAAFVVLDGSNAIGIQGLEISGAFYDVAFDFTTVGSTPEPGDLFVGDEPGAHAAANAIVAAFNGTSATTVGTGFSGTGSYSFVVPYTYADTACGSQGIVGLCAWSGVNTADPGDWGVIAAEKDNGVTVEFARFTPAANTVPLPPAAYLFLSGLAGMKWAARKRRDSNGQGGDTVRRSRTIAT